MPKLPRELYKSIKKKSPEEMYDFWHRLYTEAYLRGLRDGEEEYDDALILTEDEARGRLGEDGFIALIGGSE